MALAESVINAVLKGFKNEEFKIVELWVKLHKGAPGAAGTENAATETTRKKITFAAPASKQIKNSGALVWTNVSTTENYTHVTFWTAESGGTYQGSEALKSEAKMNAGDTFEIAAEKLILKGS